MVRHILLFILLTFSILNLSYSWDTTAAKFYPLAVGNKWSYHRVNTTGTGCVVIVSEYDFINTVISDTLLQNGKRYFKIFYNGFYRYERIDSSSMNVYSYDGMGSECLLDSLLAKKNNTFKSCRSGLSMEHLFQDTTSILFAGQQRKIKLIRGSLLVSQNYKLMAGIGLYFESACEVSGARITLNGCVINGIQYGNIIGIEISPTIIPSEFKLFQNYPNPFNPSTIIKFGIPEKSNVQLIIYDLSGKEITKLVDENKSFGTYEAKFLGAGLASGLYFYKLIANGNLIDSKKMVLLK